MPEVRFEGSEYEALNAGVAPGAAALHGLKQLIRELEPVIGAEAAERVRSKVEQTIKASQLSTEVETTFLSGLR